MTSLRDLGETVGEAMLDGVGRVSARVQEQRPLAADLLESDDAYLAVFDAPGATDPDVQVRFEDRTVHVRIDRFREFREAFETRAPGRGLSLDGSVTLPAGPAVDPGAASASLSDDGTLHVRVPKADGDDGPIDIATGDAGADGGEDAGDTPESDGDST